MTSPGPPARAIIDANLYLVLATADATGRPWSSPVYFAHEAYATFLWLSSPDVRHSRNIAARPEVAFAIFDSHAPISTGQGVYVSAVAAPSEDVERDIATFSRRSLSHGGRAWTSEDVPEDGDLRLYRAVATSYSTLAKDGRPDHRVPA